MRNEFKIILTVVFFVLLLGCVSDKSEVPPPPPLPFNGHWCDTFKSRVRQKLYTDGIINVVFDDTFKGDNWSKKTYYLDSILEYYFQMPHTPIFNDDYTNCVQPIMDSAIAAKYGVNAKDSIINEAYRLTDIVHKKENKE